MNKTIGVIGCGWLGLPLAKFLIKEGYQVHGSTTTKEKFSSLSKEGITPFLITLSEEKIAGDISNFLKGVTTLLVNVPPKLRGDQKENYVKKIALLHRTIKTTTVQKVVFISSTSVYGAIEGDVTEETIPQPTSESGRQILAAEKIFYLDKNLKTTIIRFGGLIGPDRHPITMLSGRENLPNGNYPINLIHLEDCIAIIESIIKCNWWCEIFNGVFPNHPQKSKYYAIEAKKRGLKAPQYNIEANEKGKTINSTKLILQKQYIFLRKI